MEASSVDKENIGVSESWGMKFVPFYNYFSPQAYEEICPYRSTLTNCDGRSMGILCNYVLYGRSIPIDVHLL